MSRLVLALVACAALLLPAAAWALPRAQIRNGDYFYQAGNRTTSGAISFRVSGSGARKRITRLSYRNSCLTHNAPLAAMRITRDGRFSRTFTHSSNTVMVSVRGRWIDRDTVRGTLLINETGCETKLRYRARLR